MSHASPTAVLLVCLTSTFPIAAHNGERYTVPRTEHGHPDFQGIWATAFLTMLERPPGVANLVAPPEEARKLAAAIRANAPAVVDPDFQLQNIQQLALVKGEYRTSHIVDPEDGRMPFTAAGLDLAARVEARDSKSFDDIEQRPLAERCLENMGYAPIARFQSSCPGRSSRPMIPSSSHPRTRPACVSFILEGRSRQPR